MRKLKLFLTLLMLMCIGVTQMWGADVETTYTFTSASWGAKIGDVDANWTSGAAGNAFNSGQGVQVTTGKSGANATSPKSFTDVKQVIVTYNTNASKGAGAIKIKVGDNTEVSNNVAYTSGTGTSANYTTIFNFSPYQSGSIKLTCTCTTNSIWPKSITIVEASSTPSYTITPASNNTSYGTVSIEGSVITGHPANGYRYASPAYTVTEGTATVSQNGDEFTVTPESDCTVRINFEIIPTHTVTWSQNGNTESTDDFAEGAAIVFPESASGCTGKTFVGWSASAIEGETDNVPTIVTSATMGNSDVTYYAVFATKGTGGSTSTTYSLELTGNDFVQNYSERSSSATANEVGGSGTLSVNFTSSGVMKSTNSGNPIQFRKASSGAGVLYNTTDLGTINSITYGNGSTNNIASTYKGSTQEPTSDGTGGYFKITNGSSVSYLTSITINFTITTGGGTTYSAYSTSCVAPTCIDPTIGTQPVSANYAKGAASVADLTVAATGSGTLTYQWYSNDENSNEGGDAIDGATSASYSPSVAAVGTKYYYCVVGIQDQSCSTTSDVAAINVTQTITGISLNKENTSIEIGGTETLTATIDPDDATEEAVWVSSNPSIATVEGGVVTAVAVGSATITCKSPTNGSIKGECAVTVTPHVVKPGTYNITLNNVLFGTTASTNITDEVSAIANDVTIKIDGSGQTMPRTDATYVRFYNGSWMIMSAPEGFAITQIVYTYGSTKSDETAVPEPNVGTVNSDTKTWTGKAQEVSFSFNAKAFISSISVTYAVDVKYAVAFASPAQGGTLVIKDGDDPITSGDMFDEDKALNVVVTPDEANHYIGGAISVKKTSDNSDVTKDVLNGTTLTVPAYDITVSATFTPTYAINVTADGGSVALTDDNNVAITGRVVAGSKVNVEATPDDNHTFTSLAISENASADIVENLAEFTMPAEDVSITATFVVKPTATILIKDAVTELDFGEIAQGESAEMKFSVSAHHLGASKVTLTSSNAIFSVAPAELDVEEGVIEETEITVTVSNEAAADDYIETLTISDGEGGANDITIDLLLSIKPKYTVTWNVNGTKVHEQTAVAGTALTGIPSVTPSGRCAELTFLGWKVGAIDGTVTDAPEMIDLNEIKMPNGGANYYAVFGAGGGEHSVTITNSDFTGKLDGSYSTVTIKKTIGETEYSFEVNACKQSNMCQMRDNATLSYIAIPELPGVITAISTTECANGSGSSYAGTLHFKSSKSRGNSDKDDIIKSALDGATSFTLDLSANATHKKGWLVTSAGLRIKDLTIIYNSTNYTSYMTTCPSCTEVAFTKAGEGNGNSFELQVNSAAVESVETCDAVEVTLDPTLAQNYVLTNVEVSGVTGVTYNNYVISIPKGANGELTVTASFVENIPVTGITLNKENTSIEVGTTETLTATIAPENASIQDVIWTSSNTNIATVNTEGVVTAVAAGEATITAISVGDNTKSATCAVAVTPHVVTPGAYGILLNNELFGTEVNTNISEEVSAVVNDITLRVDGSGQTKPRTDATYVRFYGSSSLTVSVPDGYCVKKIEITKNESDYSAPSVSVGSFNTSTKTWTGKAQTVVLSFNGKSFIDSIKVTYAADVKYAVTFESPEQGGTLVIKDGENAITSGATFDEGKQLDVIVTVDEDNHYIGGAISVSDGEKDITAEVLEGTTLTVPEHDIIVSTSFTPTYAISTVAEGGSIVLSYTADGAAEGYAIAGTEITATATADGLHKFSSIALSNNVEEIKSISNNVATFTMPEGAVTVTATFDVKEDASVNVKDDVNALDFGSVAQGSTPVAQTFKISGLNLEEGQLVIASNSENSKFTIDPASIDVNGTLNETTITVTPATGTAGVYEETLSIIGAGLKQADEVHITLSLTVLNTYTATWIVNGNTESPLKTQTAVAGADLTFPANPASEGDCKNLAFVGWLTSTLDEASESAPQGLISDATGLTMPENGITYYAVFAEKEGEDVAAGYSLSNAAPAAGDQVIIARLVSGTYYGLTTASNPSTSALTVSDGLVSEPANVIWDVEEATSGVYLRPTGASTGLHMNSSALKVANGNDNGDIKFTANNNGSFKGTRDDDARWIVTSSTNGLTCSATEANAAELYIFKYSAGSQATYSNYVTSCVLCNKVTLAKVGEDANNTFALQVNDADVTSVKTCSGDVAVNIVANPAIGNSASFAISGVEDASISGNVITIKEGAAGALTVTATFSQINYNVTMAQEGGANATISGNQENKHYGEEITVTAEAVEGYGFTGWTIAPEVTFVENYDASMATTKFIMPNSDVTVTANYTLIATCRFSFQVNGAEVAYTEQTQAQEYTITETGATVEGFTFLGWSETEYAEETDVLPAMIGSYTPAAGETTKNLYGIYSRVDDTDPTVGQYVRATSVTAGDYLIVCENEKVAFDGSLNKLNATGNTRAVTISNNVLTLANADNYVFTVAAIENVENGYSIKSKSGIYIGCTTSGNNMHESTETAYTNTISLADNVFTITSSGGPKLQYLKSGDNSQFKYYSSNQKAIALYKKNTGVSYYTSSPVEKVIITFDANGGEGGCARTTINKGTQLTICAEAPTKAQYDFNGWNSDADGNGTAYAAGTAYTFNADITLYAQWTEASTYTVTFDKNGGTGTAETIEDRYAGDVITLPAALTKEDFDFKGWRFNGKNYKAGASFTMPASDVAFVAQWKKSNLEKVMLISSLDQLISGMEVVFAYQDANDASKSALNGDIEEKHLTSVTANVTFDNEKKTVSYGTGVVTLIVEQVANGWTFRKNATQYLKENAAKSLAWDNKANATVWTIGFDEGNVVIANAATPENKMYYNASSPRFLTYATSGQKAIQLYGKANSITSGTTNVSDLGNMDDEIIVASGEGVILNVDVASDSVSYVAKNGATIVISATNEATKTTKSVIADSTSTIKVTKPTTVNKTFSVAATMGGGVSGQIAGSNLVTIAQSTDAYFDITLGDDANPAHWHAIAVPFPVDVINGIYDAVTGKKLENEKNYAIMEYHGDLRAQGLYGWKKIRTTLKPGVFYLMTVDGNTKTFRFKMAGTVLPKDNDLKLTLHEYAVSPNVEGTNGGWNGVANPTLEHGRINKRVQVLDPATYTYKTILAEDTNFVVGTPFFIQSEADESNVVMEPADPTKPYYAPKRVAENKLEEIKVTFGNEQYTDKLYISASEDATNEYQIGKDLAKMSMTATPKVAQIMGNAYGTILSIIDAPMSNDKAEYSLTLYAPNAGEYTISAPAMENADLYLTKDGAIIWNLSTSEYINDFEKGNNEGYGLLLIKKIAGMATGCESIEAQKTGVQKIVIDDKVFILRAGQMYDVTGKMVK